MQTTAYRLDRYRIVELATGELFWEAYAGFTRTASGRCFIRGNILFLSPADATGAPGYLRMEFEGSLGRLPRWTKTRTYCHDYAIRDSRDGKAVTAAEMLKRPGDWNAIEQTGFSAAEPVAYRLGRYEIAATEAGGFGWRTHAERDRFRTGACLIEGDILFIGGAGSTEPGGKKRDWQNHLDELPRWTRSRYFCERYSLKSCPAERPESRARVPATKSDLKPSMVAPNRPLPARAAGAHEGRKAAIRFKAPGFRESLSRYRFCKLFCGRERFRKSFAFISGTFSRPHLKSFFRAGIFLAIVSLAAGGAVFIFSETEDDRHGGVLRHRESGHRDRNRSRAEGRRTAPEAAVASESSAYRSICGGCHLAYPPELLPSRSWQKVIAGLDNHFGAAVALEADAKKAIGAHLAQNAAEFSRSKHSREIVASIAGRDPERITAVPYIQRQHRKIASAVFDRPSVGSRANCAACHPSADRGRYDDDAARIPR